MGKKGGAYRFHTHLRDLRKDVKAVFSAWFYA